jgi:hypothetical protein
VAFVDAAIRAGFLAPAVVAAKVSLPAKPSASPIEIEAFFGCRGTPTNAGLEIVTTDVDTGPHACLAVFDAHPPCEPAAPNNYDEMQIYRGDLEDDDDDDEPPTPEEVEAERAEQQARDAARDAEHARAMADHAQELAEHAKEIKALEKAFPSSPKARVRITRPAQLDDGAVVWLAAIPYENVGTCDEEWRVDTTAALIGRLPLPQLLPAVLDVWVDVPDHGDLVLAVFVAAADVDPQTLVNDGAYGFDEPEDVDDDGAVAERVAPAAVLKLPSDPCAGGECGC